MVSDYVLLYFVICSENSYFGKYLHGRVYLYNLVGYYNNFIKEKNKLAEKL